MSAGVQPCKRKTQGNQRRHRGHEAHRTISQAGFVRLGTSDAGNGSRTEIESAALPYRGYQWFQSKGKSISEEENVKGLITLFLFSETAEPLTFFSEWLGGSAAFGAFHDSELVG